MKINWTINIADLIGYIFAGVVLLVWLVWFLWNWLPIIVKQWWEKRKEKKSE